MYRIALITYDISPYRGSEASVSWNFVTKMSRHVHLTVYYGNFRDEVERYLAEHPIENVDWVNVEKKDVEHFGRGLRQDIAYTVYYRQWHRRVAELIGQAVERGEVDLIHYLNPIGFKEPGWTWKIKSVPYVWGPLQGVDNRPLKLCKALGAKTLLSACVRRIVHNGAFIFMPRVRSAFKRTDMIFAATPATLKGLKKYHGRQAHYLPENGIVQFERTAPIELNNSEPLKMVWIGGLDVARKAVGLLLDALLKVKSENWQITLFGDGQLSVENQKKVEMLDNKVVVAGKVSRAEVQKEFLKSHLHVISSMGEGNPTVIWEAMAKGVPTMTLDHCGMAGVVCERCGIKIPIDSYENVTSRMAAEIDSLIAHPQRIMQLSQGVLECGRRFMWDARIDIFLATYQRLIADYANKKSKH